MEALLFWMREEPRGKKVYDETSRFKNLGAATTPEP
jgi:hypothetical protein